MNTKRKKHLNIEINFIKLKMRHMHKKLFLLIVILLVSFTIVGCKITKQEITDNNYLKPDLGPSSPEDCLELENRLSSMLCITNFGDVNLCEEERFRQFFMGFKSDSSEVRRSNCISNINKRELSSNKDQPKEYFLENCFKISIKEIDSERHTYYRDYCLDMVALKFEDINICDLIIVDDDKIDCVIDTIRKVENAQLCFNEILEETPDRFSRDLIVECVKLVAYDADEISMCDILNESDKISTCKKYVKFAYKK
jgi:hypothetical protein